MRLPVALSLCMMAAVTLWWAPRLDAVGGSCRPRTLTKDEQLAAERVLARMRPLLPPAPPGWKIDKADTSDIGSGSCMNGKGTSVPQPVSVMVARRFRRDSPPPTAPAAPPVAPQPSAPASDPQRQARIKALEQQIAELQRQEAAVTADYQAARRAGDSPAQRAATEKSREIRSAMSIPRKELMELRRAEHQDREVSNAQLHDRAVAQTQASLANRRVANVAIYTNSGRALSRASQVIAVAGAALAITQPGFSTNLLFGNGWTHARHEAHRAWETGSLSRVQDVNVSLDGNAEVMAALIRALDMSALNALIERGQP